MRVINKRKKDKSKTSQLQGTSDEENTEKINTEDTPIVNKKLKKKNKELMKQTSAENNK